MKVAIPFPCFTRYLACLVEAVAVFTAGQAGVQAGLDLSTLSEKQQLAAIYIAYYDRAPEPTGFTFFNMASLEDPFNPISQIAADFSSSRLDKRARIASDLSAGLATSGLSGWVNRDIKEVTISTTMDTVGDSVYGLTGPNVPVTIILLIDPRLPNGPTQSISQGAIVDGKTLQDSSFGYQADQILAISIRMGGTGGREFTWVNTANGGYSGNDSLSFAPLELNGAAAQAWFNRRLETGIPSRMAFHVRHEGNILANIGGYYGTSSTLDFDDGLVIYDGTNGNFGYGTIAPFQVRDVSGTVAAFLTQARVASLQLTKAQKKVKKAEKKAKKKGVKPKKFKPVKKAEKKVKRAATSFLNVLN